ncbi:MAG: DUF4831 family protein [Tannerella sp.]|nr:DUF4831 family protein [Tannerella sp.]
MRYIYFIILMFASQFVLMSQTRVEKRIATKASGYGATYSLPITSLIITAEVVKETYKAGPYYRYAEKYLGVKDAITEDGASYSLGEITLENKGVPDANSSYTVEFKAGTVAPYIYVTEDGLLCAINTDYSFPSPTPVNKPKTSSQDAARIDASAHFTEEFLMAGSVARQAEVAAKQIYRIRESKMDILTGDAENLPPDGEAMKIVIKQLEDQEKALTSLFTGTRSTETSYYDVTLVPHENLDEEVLFRFSRKLGILDADDLGGEPVIINLKATETAPTLTPKEAEKKEKQKGIVYNVPGKASVEILYGRNSLFKGEVQVVQFGTYELLAPVMFEDKKKPVKVIFYPETGALKQIIQ